MVLRWQCEHVGAPTGPAQTHVGAYMVRRTKRAELIGPRSIVGPREIRGGGVLGPMGNTN